MSSPFQAPPPTEYDLEFMCLGVPVRVHPLFWLFTALLGLSAGNPILILIWVMAVFISVLIHELGHSLMMRFYGQGSHIVLHIGGGLAIPDSARRSRGGHNDSIQDILISLAGPFAGFALAIVTLLFVFSLGGTIGVNWFLDVLPLPYAFLPTSSEFTNSFVNDMLWVNIFWGVINLMPIYPLDGGRVSRQLFILASPWGGIRNSLMLSVITGVAIAMVGFLALGSLYMALFFGYLAIQSYLML